MKKIIRQRTHAWYFLLFAILATSCSKQNYVSPHFRQTYTEMNEMIHSNSQKIPFFKVHYKNGNVALIDNWSLPSPDTIVGYGKIFDFNRSQLYKGQLQISTDEIAIIETNQLDKIESKDKRRIAALSIITGANALLGILCITNPKACFGSCPTFYLEDGAGIHESVAEGFSNSISPVMENHDIDAIGVSTREHAFNIIMKNEALETHVVNQINLMAVARRENQTTFHNQEGTFFQCGPAIAPNRAQVQNRDIRAHVNAMDDQEYFSYTDSLDLATKEEILLEFEDTKELHHGLVLNYRQTLLTTFLLYSGLSYMGNEVSDIFAKIETKPKYKKRVGNPFELLGGVQIYQWDAVKEKWNFVEEIYETGPISKNKIIVPLEKIDVTQNAIKLKLVATKGLWRFDYLGLATIKNEVLPRQILPSKLNVLSGANFTINDVSSADQTYLISFPGDAYKFKFLLPELAENETHDLYLYSKGYYLEWMRPQWIAGKDKEKLRKMLFNDAKTWRDLAVEYKSMELEMETVFWNSKYTKVQ